MLEQVKSGAPMTPAQKIFLKDLAKQTGEKFYEDLSKVQASRRIEELQVKRRAKMAKV